METDEVRLRLEARSTRHNRNELGPSFARGGVSAGTRRALDRYADNMRNGITVIVPAAKVYCDVLAHPQTHLSA